MLVREDILRLRLPLPFIHETRINLYLLRDAKPTLIEAGPGYNITATDLVKKLEMEGISLSKIAQVVNTHEHPDHFGGNKELSELNSDIQFLAHPVAYANFDKINYSPPEEAKPYLGEERVRLLEQYAPQFAEAKRVGIQRFLNEGDELKTGKFTFQILHLPGHAPGHICLYEKEKKLLFSGDNVIGRGTPYIGRRLRKQGKGIESDIPQGDMNQYLKSLKRLMELDIECVIPAHGPVGKKERIIETYQRKLEQTERVFGFIQQEGPLTLRRLTERVYEKYAIAARLLQGSTAAYVQKLVEDGRVKLEEEGGELLILTK